MHESLLVLGLRRGSLEPDGPAVKPFCNNFLMVFASLALLEQQGEEARNTRAYMWGSEGVEYLERLGETWRTFEKQNADLLEKIFPLVLEEYTVTRAYNEVIRELRNATLFNRGRLLRKEKTLTERINALWLQMNPHLEEVAKKLMEVGVPEKDILEQLGHCYDDRLNFSN